MFLKYHWSREGNLRTICLFQLLILIVDHIRCLKNFKLVTLQLMKVPCQTSHCCSHPWLSVPTVMSNGREAISSLCNTVQMPANVWCLHSISFIWFDPGNVCKHSYLKEHRVLQRSLERSHVSLPIIDLLLQFVETNIVIERKVIFIVWRISRAHNSKFSRCYVVLLLCASREQK